MCGARQILERLKAVGPFGPYLGASLSPETWLATLDLRLWNLDSWAFARESYILTCHSWLMVLSLHTLLLTLEFLL